MSRFLSRWVLGAAFALMFLASTLYHYRTLLATCDQYDDSYITYRYALNLAEGRGLIFNRSERADAASSPLYAALLAMSYALDAHDLERVGAIIGLISGCVAVLLLVRASYRITRSAASSAIFTLPVILSGWWCGWSVSGMETTLFLALVMCFVSFYLDRRVIPAAVMLSLCIACRPEGVLLCPAIGAAALWSPTRRESRAEWAILVAGVIAFILLTLWRREYYATLLPQPVVMKHIVRYYAHSAHDQFEGLKDFLVNAFALPTSFAIAWLVITWAAIARAVYGTWRRTHATVTQIDTAPAAALASITPVSPQGIFLAVYLPLSIASVVLGPSSDMYRYATHILPLFALVGASHWQHWIRPSLKTPYSWLVGVAIAVFAIVQSENNQRATVKTFKHFAMHQTARKTLGRWIEANSPSNVTVISADLGAIAYFARSHEFVDPTGLTSRVPLAAAVANDWGRVWTWLDHTRPGLLADTQSPKGEIVSQHVLEHPETFFRGVKPLARQSRTLTVRAIPAAPRDVRTQDGYHFVIRGVAW